MAAFLLFEVRIPRHMEDATERRRGNPRFGSTCRGGLVQLGAYAERFTSSTNRITRLIEA